MANEFDERGLSILRTLLPKHEISKNGKVLTIKKDDKTLTADVNFDAIFELIDKDAMLRQQDTSAFYWSALGNALESELNKL